ncbi:hypothetical protein PR001_g31728 [Phytophthora rubi]|uniref:RxLR effector protein n=1 Tax=Phytophthora rubi TaxID=129364 RepID=A0A6A3GDE2_9STRA|nr:hypothetical protein PR001_g31728 [Phytophthora rubi]
MFNNAKIFVLCVAAVALSSGVRRARGGPDADRRPRSCRRRHPRCRKRRSRRPGRVWPWRLWPGCLWSGCVRPRRRLQRSRSCLSQRKPWRHGKRLCDCERVPQAPLRGGINGPSPSRAAAQRVRGIRGRA